MPVITFVHSDNRSEEVDANDGASVMRTAILDGVQGIVGECGGQAMCATCHVFVEQVDGELPGISDDEDEMLECTSETRQANSRLGCQLRAGDHFSKITVRVPETQV